MKTIVKGLYYGILICFIGLFSNLFELNPIITVFVAVVFGIILAEIIE